MILSSVCLGIIDLDDVIISISRDASKKAIKNQPQHGNLGVLPRKVSVKDHGIEVRQGVLIRKGDLEI